MDVGTYLERLERIDIRQLIVETLKEFESFFKDSNIDQLLKGLRSDESKIGRYSDGGNGYYSQLKASLNPLAGQGNVDLILTGEFADSIFIKFTDESMIFDASRKVKENGLDLLEHWGENVLGINKTGIEELRPLFMAKLKEKFYEKMAA